MVLEHYTYVFALGTCFALLEAFNNGANDVANAWATSVSSRSITYKWAMILGTVFEMVGALTVGARTADTIKNGIIPIEGFQGNASVQLLAFACASAGASLWVMWCTKHSAHVSSTYSLISSLAGVGVATVGARTVQWGWNGGKGLGAIYAGLVMAPTCSAAAGAVIFMLINVVVHMRKNPVRYAVWTSPFFFLLAGVICTLSIVYKGSPRLGLNDRPPAFIAGVTLGTGSVLGLLAALLFVPWAHTKVIKKDHTLRLWMIYKGPLLFWRPAPESVAEADVPDYAVVQEAEEDRTEQAQQAQQRQQVHRAESSSSDVEKSTNDPNKPDDHDNQNSNNKTAAEANNGLVPQSSPINISANHDTEQGVNLKDVTQDDYKLIVKRNEARFHAKLRKKLGPLGWAMRTLHANPIGAGQIYEKHNLIALARRIPAMIVVGALYGLNYDIHTAQTGISGTPEGKRMERVYNHAKKYPNEVEHLYSFVQIITACTASFAHGANDVGNAVGPWAAMYAAWSTGRPTEKEAPVPLWQLAVISGTISIGLVTYGYNIMKVMGNKITYHSPSRGSSMEMGAAITVLVFSQYSLPVSTSMCITGATVGVGLCNGTFKAVNWQRVGLLVFSWIMTIPVAGLIGGCLMGLLLNAPHFS